jgi:nitroreductase
MDLYECIKNRRSIRKFMAVDVERDKLGAILDAGRFAPSAGNLQSWEFVVVKDPGKIKKLADAAFQQHWIATAPVVIVVVARLEKLKQYYGIRGEKLYSIQNCAAATQNMLLMAHNIGLGACWVSAFDETMVSRIIGTTDDARPQVIIPIGYPDEEVPEPPNYTLEDVTGFESYRNKVAFFDKVLVNWNVAGKAIDGGKKFIDKIKHISKKISKEKKKDKSFKDKK